MWKEGQRVSYVSFEDETETRRTGRVISGQPENYLPEGQIEGVVQKSIAVWREDAGVEHPEKDYAIEDSIEALDAQGPSQITGTLKAPPSVVEVTASDEEALREAFEPMRNAAQEMRRALLVSMKAAYCNHTSLPPDEVDLVSWVDEEGRVRMRFLPRCVRETEEKIGQKNVLRKVQAVLGDAITKTSLACRSRWVLNDCLSQIRHAFPKASMEVSLERSEKRDS